MHPKYKVNSGTFWFYFIKYYFYCRNPLNGANPVPALTQMIFFHLKWSLKADDLNYALISNGFLKKCFDINPSSIILAAIITFFCTFQEDAIVNNLGPTESDN